MPVMTRRQVAITAEKEKEKRLLDLPDELLERIFAQALWVEASSLLWEPALRRDVVLVCRRLCALERSSAYLQDRQWVRFRTAPDATSLEHMLRYFQRRAGAVKALVLEIGAPGCAFSDSAESGSALLVPLAGLGPQLRMLTVIHYQHVVGGGVQQLPSLAGYEALEALQWEVGLDVDADVRVPPGAERLTSLTSFFRTLTPDWAACVSRMMQLQEARGLGFTITALSSLTSLLTVATSLYGTGALDGLAALPRLCHLVIADSSLEEVPQALSVLSRLTTLRLWNEAPWVHVPWTDAAVQAVAALPALRELVLDKASYQATFSPIARAALDNAPAAPVVGFVSVDAPALDPGDVSEEWFSEDDLSDGERDLAALARLIRQHNDRAVSSFNNRDPLIYSTGTSATMAPAGSGGTRLQKLLRLVEGGSSPQTRRAAAAQITGILRSHPAQLPAVLAEVAGLLRHKDWEARVAAGHCLGLIAEHFEHSGAADLCAAAGVAQADAAAAPEAPAVTEVKKEEVGAEASAGSVGPAHHTLSLASFDVQQVLEQGTPLLASGGEEYDVAVEGATREEALAAQRAALKQRLGLGGAMAAVVDTNDFFQDDDLMASDGEGLEGIPEEEGGEGSRGGGRAAAGGRRGRAAGGARHARGGSGRRGAAPSAQQQQHPAAELLAGMGAGMSTRERAAALRRAKSLKRTASGAPSAAPRSPTKRAKVGAKAEPSASGAASSEQDSGTGAAAAPVAHEQEWQEVLAGKWPFQALCDQLCLDVLHPQWEVRHGAAVGLREVLLSQAGAAGVHAPVAAEQQLQGSGAGWSAPGGSGRLALGPVSPADAAGAAAANRTWLEDCASHLLCVLALDRFGDYLSDQVVAPVRETAAQALGAAARALPRPALLAAVAALQAMGGCQQSWEARHGALLGLKYVLAGRGAGGVDPGLLAAALPVAVHRLQDVEDEVQAVAAEALLPAAPQLSAGAGDVAAGQQEVQPLLWDALLGLDQLSPACASVMTLLARLYAPTHIGGGADGSAGAGASSTSNGKAAGLCALVPRLWPYLRHGLASVRLAAAQCLGALLAAQPADELLPGAEMQRCARLLFQAHPAGCRALPMRAKRLNLLPCLQNLLVERSDDVLAASQQAWSSLVRRAPQPLLSAALPPPQLDALFRLACTPAHAALPAGDLLVIPPPVSSRGPGAAAAAAAAAAGAARPPSTGSGQGPAAQQQQEALVVVADGDVAATTRMRLAAAEALGQLGAALSGAGSAGTVSALLPCTLAALRGQAASGRLLAAFVAIYWSREQQRRQDQGQPAGAAGELRELVAAALELLQSGQQQQQQGLAEAAPLRAQLRTQASALIARALAAGVALTMPAPLGSLAAAGASSLAAQVPPSAPAEVVHAAQVLAATAGQLATTEVFLQTTVAAALAAAVIEVDDLPPKLNSIIQPLVAAVRREPQQRLQQAAAAALARLALLCASRTPSPTDKIVKNVCGFAHGDPAATPSVAAPPSLEAEAEGPEAAAATNSGRSQGKGAGAAAAVAASAGDLGGEDLAAQALALARRGGEETVRQMAAQVGADLQQRLPQLWEAMAAPIAALQQQPQQQPPPEAAQAAVNALHLLKVVAPALDASLLPTAAAPLLPAVGHCCAADSGALQLLLRELGLRLVPYALLAVVPLMGRMSDPLPTARALAARAFAGVVALLPLVQGAEPPPGLDDEQRQTLEREASFLRQLLEGSTSGGSATAAVELPVAVRGELRQYQREGVAWLAFLRRFGLHGVLADDMGLGKTLQATAVIAAATHEARAAAGAGGPPPRPSLIACPSTLVAHWPFEIGKFVAEEVLRPLQYSGTPSERASLRGQLARHDVLVMSYEHLRADADWVASIDWLYCVLDEGHAIRNPASKASARTASDACLALAVATVAQAAKRVRARHRLLLSGTPIQNGVGELWALFDFLMPGFLGSERAFHARYGRALAAARAGRRGGGGGGAEAEAGVLALDSLHRQVTPFILRRTKDQVLSDLPPKVIQDLVVEPSPLQAALYEDFAQSQAMQAITGVVQSGALAAGGGGAEGGAGPHVFQALSYLRKLCSHPLLVLDPGVEQHVAAVQRVLGAKAAADWPGATAAIAEHLSHAPKLAALRELLLDCGIGREGGGKRDADDESAGVLAGGAEGGDGAGHRVLVFAHLKALLDLVESQARCLGAGAGAGAGGTAWAMRGSVWVLAPLGVAHLRIDGGVEAGERFRRVQRFNADPTIEVMLLTTQVGGLGLNLTSADTVVFLEHSWNPQQDLQAMDRAHRLGQRRTVNVYRLIVRGTLEEQVLSLQRFKLEVAAAVVNADNLSLDTMDTSAVLDLMAGQGQQGQQAQQGAAGKGGGARPALAAALERLEAAEAAAEEQYGRELGVDAFQARLQ
eukprot:scaffold8.g1519.t1